MNPLSDAAAAARIADDAEAQAFRDLFAAAPAALADQLGLRVADIGGATLLMAPRLPATMFNRAIGLGLHEPATRAAVEAIAQAYRDAGIANWWLHWNPHAQPAGLEQELQAMGFSLPQRRSWAKMLRSPDAPPAVATSLQVREAQASEMREVAAIAAQAFDMPPFMADWLACLHGGSPWHMYAVLDGAQVVGGGMLWVRGDAAWLGIGSVAPSHRRRGGQQALMALRIAAAGQHGARHVVTETGEPTAAGEANPSLANMKRCGFRQVASRLNFAAPA